MDLCCFLRDYVVYGYGPSNKREKCSVYMKITSSNSSHCDARFCHSAQLLDAQGDGAPVLVWLVVKLLVVILPFCILLRIVAVVRDVHLRQDQGNAAEQSQAAVLWVCTPIYSILK